MGSAREGTGSWFTGLPIARESWVFLLSFALLPFLSKGLKKQNKTKNVSAWENVPSGNCILGDASRWILAPTGLSKHFSQVVKRPLINTTLGTRTWKISPPYRILGSTMDKVPSHSSLYLVLTSDLGGKQTSGALSTLQGKRVCSRAGATASVNSALAEGELLT